MNHRVPIMFSKEILKKANFRFWRRSLGIWKPFSLLIPIVLFIYLIFSGDRSWQAGAIGASIVVMLGVIFGVYLTLVGRAMKRFDQMRSKTVEFTFTESGIATKSDLGSGELPWSQIERIWEYPDMWLLVYGSSAFVTLPLHQVDADTLAFIRARLDANRSITR